MNRSILVTGGSRGIGLAIARTFAEAGDNVAIISRSGEIPDDLAHHDILAIECDITDTRQVEAAITTIEERQGPVQVLVANAGVTKDALLVRMSEQDFTSVVDTNLNGTFRVVKRALAGMLRARQGRITLISSVVGLSGSPGQANYAASKAALVGLARSLARELGPRNITVNVVAPGFVETSMTAALNDQRRQEVLSGIPLGRCATPAEIASAAFFLSSDEAAYITGAVIPVDGGWGMGH